MYQIYDVRTGLPISSQVFASEADANFAAMQLSKCYPDKLLRVDHAQ